MTEVPGKVFIHVCDGPLQYFLSCLTFHLGYRLRRHDRRRTFC